MRLTESQYDAVQQIKGSIGWKVIEHMVQQKMQELESVHEIADDVHPFQVAVQTLSRQKAHKLLDELLRDVGFITKPSTSQKTYE